MPKQTYKLDREDVIRLSVQINAPPNYIPGKDPILDKVLLDRTNKAWKKLGKKYGFQWDTAKSLPGCGPEFVEAIPIQDFQ